MCFSGLLVAVAQTYLNIPEASVINDNAWVPLCIPMMQSGSMVGLLDISAVISPHPTSATTLPYLPWMLMVNHGKYVDGNGILPYLPWMLMHVNICQP